MKKKWRDCELMGRNYCVYEHVNKINGKKYIGMTKDPKSRWRSDGYEYRRCTHFWSAIQKYGWDNFEHTIIRKELTHMEACELEIKLIAEQETIEKGYNLASGGNGGRLYQEHPRGMLGKSQTEYQKQVMREYMSNPENNPMMNRTTVEVTEKDGTVRNFRTIRECGRYYNIPSTSMNSIFNSKQPYIPHKRSASKPNHKAIEGFTFRLVSKTVMGKKVDEWKWLSNNEERVRCDVIRN